MSIWKNNLQNLGVILNFIIMFSIFLSCSHRLIVLAISFCIQLFVNIYI